MNMLFSEGVDTNSSLKIQKIQDTKNMLVSNIIVPESFLYDEKVDAIDRGMIIEKLKNFPLFGGINEDFFEIRFFTDLIPVLIPELKDSFVKLYSKQDLYTDTLTLALEGVLRPNYVLDNVGRHVYEYLKGFFEKIDGASLIRHLSEDPGFVVKNVKLSAIQNELILQFPPKN